MKNCDRLRRSIFTTMSTNDAKQWDSELFINFCNLFYHYIILNPLPVTCRLFGCFTYV